MTWRPRPAASRRDYEHPSRLPHYPIIIRGGYKESDIKKILGENTVRLLADVERVAVQMRAEKRP